MKRERETWLAGGPGRKRGAGDRDRGNHLGPRSRLEEGIDEEGDETGYKIGSRHRILGFLVKFPPPWSRRSHQHAVHLG